MVTPLRALVIVVGLCLVVGVWLDRQSNPDQPDLFWPIFLASVVGVTFGGVLAWRRCGASVGNLLGWIAAIVILWRISYFAHLVFAGFLASLFEAMLHAVHPDVVVLYPVFLLSIFGLHLGSSWLLSFAVRQPSTTDNPTLALRWSVVALAVPMLVVAGLVSFTDRADWTLLPDRPAPVLEPLPQPGTPHTNPYLPRVGEPDRPLAQRVLLVCAGLTYDFIPHSPWAVIVKGTLEEEMNRRPRAGSQQRIREHYLAYLVAHRALHRKP